MPEVERAFRRTTTVGSCMGSAYCLAYALAEGTVNDDIISMIVFLVMGLSCVGALAAYRKRWRREDERRASLLTTGTRVPAVLVSSRRTKVRVWGGRVLEHPFEYRGPSAVLRVEARALTSLPVGTPATVMYARNDPSVAGVVEDLDQLASRGPRG